MIGDLLSTLANSNKLSIEQLQQAVQDGTVPSYIGIPMISQKVQQRQQAMSMLQGMQQQGQPPIGQQIMDQASQITHGGMSQQLPMAAPQQAPMPQQPPMAAPQQAPQGITSVPTNLPAQGYAPGGIVAFADGGEAKRFSGADKQSQVKAPVTNALQNAADWWTGIQTVDNSSLPPDQPYYEVPGTIGNSLSNTTPTLNMGDAGSIPQDQMQAWADAIGSQPSVAPAPAPAASAPASTGATSKPITLADLGLTMPPSATDQLSGLDQRVQDRLSGIEKLIYAQDPDAQELLKRQTLASIMTGGFKMMGPSPFAAANISAGGEELGKGINAALVTNAQQKQDIINKLVNLGYTGAGLDMKLKEMGITATQQDFQNQVLAKELPYRLNLLNAQTQAQLAHGDYFRNIAAIRAAGKGPMNPNIPFDKWTEFENKIDGAVRGGKDAILSSPLADLIPPVQQGGQYNWIRQGLDAEPGSPSYQKSIAAVQQLAKEYKDSVYRRYAPYGVKNQPAIGMMNPYVSDI